MRIIFESWDIYLSTSAEENTNFTKAVTSCNQKEIGGPSDNLFSKPSRRLLVIAMAC